MINVRKEAYKIISKTLKNNVFSDKLLQKVIKKLRKEKKDTNFLYMLVKGVIKMKKNLDYIARQFTDESRFDKTNLKIKIILYLGLYQIKFCDFIPSHAAVNETVELAKQTFGDKVAKFINAVLRSYLRNPKIQYPENEVRRIATEHSYPEKIVEYWINEFGEENAEYLAMYFNEVPRLHMRVNPLATSRRRVKNYFANRDVETQNSKYSRNVLTSNHPSLVLNNISFEEGYFSIQDTSSVAVVELLDPMPDESIIDFFAGRGGKASYISELMNDTGELIAIDKFPKKVKQMKRAFERLNLKNTNYVVEDAFKFGPVAPAYDRVIIDVPCSGWGVFQKKSELRWQQNQDLKSLLKIQEKALNNGAKFIKPGGIFVYSTCTMNKAENEEQIDKFLKKHKNFKLEDASNYVHSDLTENKFLKTYPHIHHVDGVFAARMKKDN